ncbi:transcriptional regulator AmtR [Gordonia jinhuaensis]|uniref:TetR family transcriptional regulator n=1 Tax=Gordonia jinhuaensis TaxID=1517702 RepID=A0A916T272_9ACTN|nr:TetR/AcrR family transcriptional regulator [Gordonia jinhuaensis]GGB28512.1 TetR family transcriptional regulator [Gordonia jinhuaensis]
MKTNVGPGRPRLVEQRRRGGNPREEILDAAAELFTTHGYAGTSTRKIAEAVGMRQASLYHHFATKEDILEALLQSTVAPTLDYARALPPASDASIAREQLLALARFDAGQLAGSRWNLGALYLLPELRQERFAEFFGVRTELARVYSGLSAQILGDEQDPRCHLPFRLVEMVINLRSDGEIRDTAPSRRRMIDALVSAVDRLLS